jgi:hypothetical protein
MNQTLALIGWTDGEQNLDCERPLGVLSGTSRHLLRLHKDVSIGVKRTSTNIYEYAP